MAKKRSSKTARTNDAGGAHRSDAVSKKRRYFVRLPGAPEWEVEATSEDDARAAYNRHFGVIASEHKHEIVKIG